MNMNEGTAMTPQSNQGEPANTQATDIFIAGAGMVGAAAALGLAQQGYRVLVAEPQLQTDVDGRGDYDLRISAVTTDNITLLKQLGAWDYIHALRVQPFYQLAVRHHAGEWLTLGREPSQQGAQGLGFMIENRVIQYGLLQAMRAEPLIMLVEAQLETLDSKAGTASLSNGQSIRFGKVLGCDGAQSKVRQASGIGVAGRQYGQSCLLTVVKCANDLPARTWESFAQQGEIHALLPLTDNQACLILYGSRTQVAHWQQSHEQLQAQLETRFQSEIGPFELLNYGSFPLTRQSAQQYTKDRTILLGDAAHTIHPMAGQGVNLGFRDVKMLLKVSRGVKLTDTPPTAGARLALTQFELVRRADNELMAQAMDSIGWAFKQNAGPVAGIRNAVLGLLQRSGSSQKVLTAYASGVWKL